MFRPVSTLTYRLLAPEAQILVVTCPLLRRNSTQEIQERWNGRACAAIHDSSKIVRHVVRDLLNNPHIRAVVFDGPCCGRSAYDDFWLKRTDVSAWNIEEEHLTLVRQFVDLFDDDFTIRKPLQPFWPARIMYLSA